MAKAVVLGATGAVGEHVVGWLCISGAWSEVVAIGRRPVTVPAEYTPDTFRAKLEQVTVNMDELASAKSSFQGAHSVFCCLGTTRKAAGSAEQFRKVDYEYVKAAAEVAKSAGVQHFALLTAQGSTPNVWANDWKMFHGLLYMKMKGLAEEAVKSQAFRTTSIFRPGLIGRGDKARGIEKMLLKIGGTHIPAPGLAKLMVQDAQARLASSDAPATTPVAVYEMRDLLRALKEDKVLCEMKGYVPPSRGTAEPALQGEAVAAAAAAPPAGP